MNVAVVGACGAVGTAVAGRLAERAELDELLLYDVDLPELEVTTMDIAPVAARYGTRVRSAGGADIGGADVVVFCAARPHRAGMPRADMLAENLGILEAVVGDFGAVAPGLMLLASNPVDALVHSASRLLPGAIVAGHSMNDTLRLRHEVARSCGSSSSAAVQAWWLGAHGGRGVAVWGADGPGPGHRAGIEANVRRWYDDWQRHGTTRTTAVSTAHGVVQLLDAYFGLVPPATLVLSVDAGLYGAPGTPIGLPVRVSAGRLDVCRWQLDDEDLAGLLVDAAAVSAMVAPQPVTNGGTSKAAARQDPVTAREW